MRKQCHRSKSSNQCLNRKYIYIYIYHKVSYQPTRENSGQNDREAQYRFQQASVQKHKKSMGAGMIWFVDECRSMDICKCCFASSAESCWNLISSAIKMPDEVSDAGHLITYDQHQHLQLLVHVSSRGSQPHNLLQIESRHMIQFGNMFLFRTIPGKMSTLNATSFIFAMPMLVSRCFEGAELPSQATASRSCLPGFFVQPSSQRCQTASWLRAYI